METEASLNKKSVAQLKDMLKSKKLDQTGLKADLVQRLLDSQKPSLLRQPSKESGEGTLFFQYADPESKEELSGDYLSAFIKALGIDETKEESLYVPFILKSRQQGVITKAEWDSQFGAMKSINDIKQMVQSYKNRIQSNHKDFVEFARWLFLYACGNQKALDVATANALWGLILPQRWPLAQQWLDFTVKLSEQKVGSLKAVSKDLWEQVCVFLKEVKPDLSNFDPDAAWPGALDEFVNHVRTQQPPKGS